MAKNDRLTTRQQGAIRALLDPSTPTIATAAKAAGVSQETLYRWMREDAAFTAALSDAQGAAIDGAVRQLTALAERAILVVHSVLVDRNASDSARLRAATIALEMLLRLKDAADFETRLRALEARDGTE